MTLRIRAGRLISKAGAVLRALSNQACCCPTQPPPPPPPPPYECKPIENTCYERTLEDLCHYNLAASSPGGGVTVGPHTAANKCDNYDPSFVFRKIQLEPTSYPHANYEREWVVSAALNMADQRRLFPESCAIGFSNDVPNVDPVPLFGGCVLHGLSANPDAPYYPVPNNFYPPPAGISVNYYFAVGYGAIFNENTPGRYSYKFYAKIANVFYYSDADLNSVRIEQLTNWIEMPSSETEPSFFDCTQHRVPCAAYAQPASFSAGLYSTSIGPYVTTNVLYEDNYLRLRSIADVLATGAPTVTNDISLASQAEFSFSFDEACEDLTRQCTGGSLFSEDYRRVAPVNRACDQTHDSPYEACECLSVVVEWCGLRAELSLENGANNFASEFISETAGNCDVYSKVLQIQSLPAFYTSVPNRDTFSAECSCCVIRLSVLTALYSISCGSLSQTHLFDWRECCDASPNRERFDLLSEDSLPMCNTPPVVTIVKAP